MRSHRSGFTLLELTIALSIALVLVSLAAPRLRRARERAILSNTHDYLVSSLATGRAAAIQRGRRVDVVITGGLIKLADGTSSAVIGQPVRLDSTQVSISATSGTISFDSRGFATGLPMAGATYVLTRGDRVDSVCVTRLGMIMERGCGS